MARPGNDGSAGERAYQGIRDCIIEGRCPPGTMLAEASLAADLGVSRTPVRTALARLQDEGWITIYPKRGALVHGLDERARAELADTRAVLESTSVGRASDEVLSRLAERLERSVEAQREAFAAGDLKRFIGLTNQFHRGFVEAGGNRIMLELNDRLSDRQRFVLFASGDRLLTRCMDIIAEHELLIEHLRSGDAAAFSSVLRRHISDTYATAVPELPFEESGDLVGH